MGLVSCLIFPSNLAPKLMTLADGLFRRVDRFAENATDPPVDQKQLVSEREALAKDFGEVETMRSSSFFESAEARLVDPLLRGALHAAVNLCAAAEAVATDGRSQFEQDSNRGCAITEAGGGTNENDGSRTTFALVGAAYQRTLNAARAWLATCVGASSQEARPLQRAAALRLFGRIPSQQQ